MDRNHCTAIIIASICNLAQADSLCDTVLKSGAFNITDYTQTSSLLLKKRSDACRSEYNSAAEASSAARQSGASIGYGPFSFGASDAKQTTSGKYSISDSKFCNASAEDIDALTSVSARQQVADVAINAWSTCITTTEQNKLFIQYEPNADGSGITGTIIRRLASTGNMGEITGITSSNSDTSISCKIGTESIELNKSYSIKIEKGNTAFSCAKDPSKNIKVSLTTSVGDQEWIDLPSFKNQEQTKIQDLQDSINNLKFQIKKSIPQNTIAAFKLEMCPQGWVEFQEGAGRVILGAGQGQNLSARKIMEIGGAETHTLTAPEMPRHRHQLPTYNGVGGAREVGSGRFGADLIPEEFSEFSGQDRPHNNMQPYIALKLCIKVD